jgi:hypothetical protein
MPNHQRIDERSSALAMGVAERIRLYPKLVGVPKRNVAAWLRARVYGAPPSLKEWRSVSNGPMTQVTDL